ncbi:YncE family protein [Pseudoflavitalea sp. G-6-1-2]|uniref:YncE family protein n=1 Tax=Pseudoflavitalea sp. G-6-1-2 TaxID=2728841 RepID=UPI00146D9C6F|nr:YncE family protein [Pseudoflavitalea sp. G-6-1-2]NML23804.1 YncE family protein [Pseudoflavitalea sp. G-6-1-2]
MKYTFIAACSFLLLLGGCRKDEPILKEKPKGVTDGMGPNTHIKGFFLLNEANMGSNKSSIDYFDYETGVYRLNLFPSRNPTVSRELGDVGNDIQIYGNKLYAVINVSHLVEVMDVNTAKHIATISIPNCRYITFSEGMAYVSSYAGPVQLDPNARLGYVARFDTTNLKVIDTCVVGYQPEEMVIRDKKLYVANSGGYRFPNYDNTVSVIDLNTFKETKKIPVAINLHRLELDNKNNIYVTSRGDYKSVHSNTFILDANDQISDVLDLPASNITICGDSAYVYSTEWSHVTQKNEISYAIVDTRTKKVVSRNFITDGTEKSIKIPYGIAVNPETREIYVTDAKNYVTSGEVLCFSPQGKLKWRTLAGNIPAHIVFTTKRLSDQ